MRLSQGGEAIRTDFQVFRNANPDETDHDDPPNPKDTNVYGLVSLKNGKHLVTDAGGNELLLVDSKGRVKTVAKFPNADISTAHLPPDFGLPPTVDSRGRADGRRRRPRWLLVRR